MVSIPNPMSKLYLAPLAALLVGCVTDPATLTGGESDDGSQGATSDAETTDATTGASNSASTTETPPTTTPATSATSGTTSTSTTEGTTGETETGPTPCSLDVGVSGPRRLTATQYRNTTATLLGVAVENVLPPDRDVSSSGFEPTAYASAAVQTGEVVDFDAVAGCADDEVCGENYVAELVPLAFRRPAAQAEVDEFVAVYASALGTVGERIESAVEVLLADARFYEIAQTGTPWADDPSITELEPYALASRLAYFTTNGMPDAELRATADDGSILEAATLAEQANRLLRGPSGSMMIADYYEALLDTSAIADDPKDASFIPPWSAELADDMRREQALFVQDLFFGAQANPTLDGLLTSTYSFVNGPLASLYDEDLAGGPPGGNGFARVELDPARRPGILSRLAFLSARAGSSTWDPPSRRGTTALSAFACMVVPASPPDLTPAEIENLEEWNEVISPPGCVSCHAIIDPFGSALNTYDGLGRWQPNGSTADELILEGSDGPIAFEDLNGLVDGLLAQPTIEACAVQRQFEFAMRRETTEADMCTLLDLEESFTASGGNLRTLFLDIVDHTAFRLVRAE